MCKQKEIAYTKKLNTQIYTETHRVTGHTKSVEVRLSARADNL